ncbi:MAG: hypothetical protein IJV40_12105 [Oscillospiraceae bacterium]|nr:hypothetical protein [Oscillospiraceae bacterium]
MSDDKLIHSDDPLIVYCYRQISDAAVFSDLLTARFSQACHDRPVEFRFWDCYQQPPGPDGDLYIFDGMILSALAAKGYIRRLPDIIDTSGIFEWVLNGSKVRNQIFGIPFMLCSNVLISREGETTTINSLLPGQIAAPLQSMIGEYYVLSYFNSPHRDEGSLNTLKRLRKLIGGSNAYERSRFSQYDGIERFIRGECKYLLGFTEDLRYLPPNNYVVQSANISESIRMELPFQYVNYVSVGMRPRDDRLLDCLDLIEILADSQFFLDYCTLDGQMRYLLPANRNLYTQLCALDGLYEQLYAIVSDENNCVLRYGKQFYEEFPQKSAQLRSLLANCSD